MEARGLPASVLVGITPLAGALDARRRVRFVTFCSGRVCARGRRTVTRGLRACATGRDSKRYSSLLGSVGCQATASAGGVLRLLPSRLPAPRDGAPRVFALDDSPTQRYGPHVEGAGKHHNPTPGPAGSKSLSGHVWVCLARLVRHPERGEIALAIRSHLDVRAKAVGGMAASSSWEFRTQLELAAARVQWLVGRLGADGPPVWVVTNGASAQRSFLKAVLKWGVTVISRF